MSERQLPADRRSRIQQGFAASLLLTPLLFFWIFLLQMSPWRGEAYTGGAVARWSGDQPPVIQSGRDRGAGREFNVRPAPAGPRSPPLLQKKTLPEAGR